MSDAVRVEFRVPVSPSPEFALMLSVLSSSIRRWSGLVEPRITVFIGAPPSDRPAVDALATWMAPEMRPVIVDAAAFEARSFHATAEARIDRPSDADVVILIDADTVVCGSLADVCGSLASMPALAGVIAHAAPVTQSDWRRAFVEVGAEPRFPFQYSGWPYLMGGLEPTPSLACAPAYFNLGFVGTTPGLLGALSEVHGSCVAAVERLFPDSMYRSQMSLALAAAAAPVPTMAIPMRYNFPNDFRLEALHPDELRQARMIHLLRREQGVDKRAIYRSLDALRGFVAASWRLAGAAARAHDAIEQVLPEVERKGLPPELSQAAWRW